MHETGPFSIPSIRSFVPEKWKPWVVIAIVLVFQLSGGVYLAAVSEMAGSTALLREDIMMAGYASMVGMSLTFTIMFRLKFRFASKTSLLTCCIALILCNLICMHTRSVPVLVATCFFAGIFRMWGTFECNSTIQLWLTPKRDLSVFFCFIYLLVQGCIQLSGLATVYVSFWSKWESMHWLVIALFLLAMMGIMILFRTYRSMRKLPLYGIDWLGGFMWGLTVMCIVFVCVYGEHYDWYDSDYIRMATVGGVVVLALNLWRASFIRHPFIAIETWRFRAVYLTFTLYLVIEFLLAPAHLFEHIYMESVLGFDSLNYISMNWIILLGVVLGSVFTYLTFSRRKWRYKTMAVIAFTCITGYLMFFYFTIDYRIPKEAWMFPLFLRAFGYVIIEISFITMLSRVPFQNFFQAVSIQGFASTTLAGVIGSALLGRILTVVMTRNAVSLGATLDRVNQTAVHLPFGQLYGALQEQALMVTMKELYGWLTLLSLFCLLIFGLHESSIRPYKAIHPAYRTIRRFVKHELRMRGG